MQDSRTPRIFRAIHLGHQIHDLEGERYLLAEQIRELEEMRDPLLLEQSDRQKEINRLNRALDLLWLEVGKLKHSSGE